MAAESKKRVKVYSYNENLCWDDVGTGHVSLDFIERNNALTIIVRSEEDGSILLESKFLPDRAYQKQEETLIVWTEDESCDLAISFQEKAGCDDMWASICEIQGRSPESNVTQEVSEDGELSDRCEDASVSVDGRNFELPPCELSKLEEIHDLIVGSVPMFFKRETLALSIQNDGYIMKLIELFHTCEDKNNAAALKQLHNIFKGLLLFNKAGLLQVMFQDDIILDVVGCLEYESEKPRFKHRDYVSKTSQKQIVPFTNSDLLAKIHQTYRVQYIRDVFLPVPSLFDENKYAALNSFLLFNKSEIVTAIQDDNSFLSQLFRELSDDGTSVDRYKDLVELLREICNFSMSLESKERTQFYTTLSSYGFMKAIEGMLVSEEGNAVIVAVDILHSIAEFNCSIPIDYILQTVHTVPEDNQLLNIIISLLVDGEYVEIDVQLVGLIKSMIIPESSVISENTAEETSSTTQQSVTKTLFLNYLYQHCMHRLMAPLMAHTATEKITKDTHPNSVLLSHILEIVSPCVGRHTYHVRNYIINKNILARVLVLMTSSHGHLVLAALRFCRRIVSFKDEFFNRYIMRNNLFNPILKTFMTNGQRYNLINSAIIELFDFITKEKIKSLIAYVVDNFMITLDTVEYVDTFKSLKLAYEQERDRLELESQESSNPPLKEGILHLRTTNRFRRDPRELDEDEEAWFDNEEEDVETVPVEAQPTNTSSLSESHPPVPITTSQSPRPSPFTHVSYSPRPIEAKKSLLVHHHNTTSSSSPNSAVLRSQALLFLADYDEDSDEENDQDISSAAKRQRLNDT